MPKMLKTPPAIAAAGSWLEQPRRRMGWRGWAWGSVLGGLGVGGGVICANIGQ
jgi:hypothetical protein